MRVGHATQIAVIRTASIPKHQQVGFQVASGFGRLSSCCLETILACCSGGVRLPQASKKSLDFPEFPRTSLEVPRRLLRNFSVGNLRAIQWLPGSFPDFLRSSPDFPRSSPDLPRGQLLSLLDVMFKADTLSRILPVLMSFHVEQAQIFAFSIH